MQLLIRKLVEDAQGQQSFIDIELDTATIDIGSAPKSELQLLGPNISAKIATMYFNSGQLSIKSQGIEVNGKLVKKSLLNIADKITVAGHTLTIIEAPTGFDAAIEWRSEEVDESQLSQAYATQLSDLTVTPRMLSWLLVILIISITAAAFNDYYSNRVTDIDQGKQAFRADLWLSSGPLHKAHQALIGDQCEACHTEAFEQVTDTACQQCHIQTNQHLPDLLLSDIEHPQQFDTLQCQNCHKEHNEPTHITITASQLCTDCHRYLEQPIENFSAQGHPAFALDLLMPTVISQQNSFRVDWHSSRQLPHAELKEVSHLKFPHDVHLNADKVTDLTSDESLSCNSCHSLEADREHFKPIDMEQHCSACHDLSFDEDAPQQTLPHGKPEEVWQMLQAYYISKYFNLDNDKPSSKRRIPAKISADINCKADIQCANQLAEAEAERQFTSSGCITCHAVKTIDGVEARSRWQVLPVKLSADWYSRARFDHQSHLTQSGERSDQLCLSCHAADSSSLSEDILMPEQDNCLQCHDTHSSSSVQLECVDCHSYHLKADHQQVFLHSSDL